MWLDTKICPKACSSKVTNSLENIYMKDLKYEYLSYQRKSSRGTSNFLCKKRQPWAHFSDGIETYPSKPSELGMSYITSQNVKM